MRQSDMKIGIRLPHHDHSYVEARGGWPLLTHLRGAASRMRYRTVAIDRAYDAFVAAEEAGCPDAEVGGLGLLVMQRALLAAEDLGGLLHAFGGADPWLRLVTTRVLDLDAAFERAVRDPRAALGAFRLIDDETLRHEPFAPDERAALTELVAVTERRWTTLLRSVAELWLTQGKNAKATMHGFPVVAGEHVLGPPSAGELATDITPSPYGRFAVVVLSRVRGTHVVTDRSPVRLDRDAVMAMRAEGRTAATLMTELCEAQAGTIMSGHRVAVPLAHLEDLPTAQREVITDLVERRRHEEAHDDDT